MLRLILLLSVALLLNGCSAPLKLQLDAISLPDQDLSQQRFVLLSGDPNINSDDLYYQEFSRFAEYVLKQAGLQPADNIESATQRVYFSYGVADGGTERYTYSTPVYEFVGGETYTITERSALDSGAVETKTTEVYVPFNRQLVGRDYHTRSITHYRNFIRLEGRDNSEAATQRWMVSIELISDSNDLRRLLPIMMSRAAPYVGKNSGKIVQIKISPDDTQAQQFVEQVNARP